MGNILKNLKDELKVISDFEITLDIWRGEESERRAR